MTLIDRYVLFLFIRTLLICCFSFVGLVVVVHFFANVDEFIEYGRAHGSVARVLLEYYGPYTLSILDRLYGLLILMSVMFVIAWLYRTNELTAILAAGISKGRVIRPLLIGSSILFALAAINREIVIPRYADILGKNPQDFTGQKKERPRSITDEEFGFQLGGQYLFKYQNEISEPIFLFDGPSLVLGKQLTAVLARFIKGDSTHPRGFLLDGVRSPADIDQRDSVKFHGRDFVLTHKDTAWLAPGQCFVISSISIDLLQSGSTWRQFASTFGLIRQLRAQPHHYGDDTRIAVHTRLIQPFLDVTLFLLGIPIVLTRPDRHLFWVVGMSLLIVGGFMVIVMGFQTLGSHGSILSPVAAAWSPLLLLFPPAWIRAKNVMQS